MVRPTMTPTTTSASPPARSQTRFIRGVLPASDVLHRRARRARRRSASALGHALRRDSTRPEAPPPEHVRAQRRGGRRSPPCPRLPKRPPRRRAHTLLWAIRAPPARHAARPPAGPGPALHGRRAEELRARRPRCHSRRLPSRARALVPRASAHPRCRRGEPHRVSVRQWCAPSPPQPPPARCRTRELRPRRRLQARPQLRRRRGSRPRTVVTPKGEPCAVAARIGGGG